MTFDWCLVAVLNDQSKVLLRYFTQSPAHLQTLHQSCGVNSRGYYRLQLDEGLGWGACMRAVCDLRNVLTDSEVSEGSSVVLQGISTAPVLSPETPL